jgi:hypothetical protein
MKVFTAIRLRTDYRLTIKSGETTALLLYLRSGTATLARVE